MRRIFTTILVAILIVVINSYSANTEAFFGDPKNNSNGMNISEPVTSQDPSPDLNNAPEKIPENQNNDVDAQPPSENQPGKYTSILILVNKSHWLSSDYVPSDLVEPEIDFSFSGNSPKKLMRSEAAESLSRMFIQAAQEGVTLLGVSGYRSYNTQAAIFAANAKQKGELEANKTSARAGQSEHQTGLAMDITCSRVYNGLSANFGETPEGIWVAQHAADFGFIVRYQAGKENITGYSYEPWHLRYVGAEAAKAIYQKDITLEEYLGQN